MRHGRRTTSDSVGERSSMTAITKGSRTTAAGGHVTASVVSSDGTTVGYRQFGDGPGIVVVHGSMSSAAMHVQIAEALADTFTVSLVDRRGRGLSGPYPREYGIQTEVADLEATLVATGSRFVFGVSTGAIIGLLSALRTPTIRRLALFEPPLLPSRAAATAILARFDREVEEGNLAAALITAMRGAQMGSALFNRLPRWLTERMTRVMLARGGGGSDGTESFGTLAPTLHYDLRLVAEASGAIDPFRGVSADVLLLGGSRSPRYLSQALDRLEGVLPHARRVEVVGVGHAASWNTEHGGKPALVARELKAFFIGS